jgi:hypothetical protein
MPRPKRLPCWLLAAGLLVCGCRPADAPKEPTKPNDDDPKVSAAPTPGGVGMAFARRTQALALQ